MKAKSFLFGIKHSAGYIKEKKIYVMYSP